MYCPTCSCLRGRRFRLLTPFVDLSVQRSLQPRNKDQRLIGLDGECAKPCTGHSRRATDRNMYNIIGHTIVNYHGAVRCVYVCRWPRLVIIVCMKCRVGPSMVECIVIDCTNADRSQSSHLVGCKCNLVEANMKHSLRIHEVGKSTPTQ